MRGLSIKQNEPNVMQAMYLVPFMKSTVCKWQKSIVWL